MMKSSVCILMKQSSVASKELRVYIAIHDLCMVYMTILYTGWKGLLLPSVMCVLECKQTAKHT